MLGVGGAAPDDMNIAEVACFGVVLEVRRPHDSHLGAQVQLLAQVRPTLHHEENVFAQDAPIWVVGCSPQAVTMIEQLGCLLSTSRSSLENLPCKSTGTTTHTLHVSIAVKLASCLFRQGI